MAAYYNEIDPYAAEWLRNLIMLGHIADGIVDTRSISEVEPDELRGFTQCHFFAGIGVWSYALRLAGWPDDRPVWTGSCPCQPFSSAGRSGGFADERHLWPHWQHLIRECRPGVVFGEQVASKDGLAWLDLVHDDMEGEGYAFTAVDLCAAGVGAPHIRQRLFFVADAYGEQRQQGLQPVQGGQAKRARGGKLANVLGNADDQGLQEYGKPGDIHLREPDRTDPGRLGIDPGLDGGEPRGAGPTNGHWRLADWLYCRDGKWRPVEPGSFPLAHGAPARVGRLRAYGNAIVPQVAAEVIRAFIEVR